LKGFGSFLFSKPGRRDAQPLNDLRSMVLVEVKHWPYSCREKPFGHPEVFLNPV
jgi:uncharacterized Zn-finger protein